MSIVNAENPAVEHADIRTVSHNLSNGLLTPRRRASTDITRAKPDGSVCVETRAPVTAAQSRIGWC
jgi:hypothetical protein